MITLLLLKQIAQLFLCIILGWLLVRLRLLKAEDSRVLSVVSLYIINPCVIINAFQMEQTPELLHALALSLGAAVAIHLLMFLMTGLLRRPLRLTPVEQASVIYSNAGNLIVPVVTAVLGKDWVIFTSMYLMVQLCLMWSHGRILLSGERNVSFRKIFSNINIVSILIGAALFFLEIPLPGVLAGTMESIGVMIGPVSMLIAGMLLGGEDLLQILRMPKIWKVISLRLIVVPLVVMCLMKYSGAAHLVPDGFSILLVSLLATSAPSASAVTQIAQVYGSDGEYAGAINVVTSLLCIVTMPLVVLLYQL